MITIQGTYTKITTALAVPNLYSINPFDLYGNLLNEMTIEVDSTLAQPVIFLPAIADLNNNWQIKINVIATTGSINPVSIGVANPPDKIGAEYNVDLVSDGANIEINPIGANNWYGVPADVQTGGVSAVDFTTGTFESFFSVETPIVYQVGTMLFGGASNRISLKTDLDNCIEINSPNVEQIYAPFSTVFSTTVSNFAFSARLTNLSLPKLKHLDAVLVLTYRLSAFNLILPELVYLTELKNESNSPMTFSFPKLKALVKCNLTDYILPNLIMPELEFVGDCAIQNSLLVTNISLPKLKTANQIYLSNISITNMNGFASLETAQQFAFMSCTTISNFTLPLIKTLSSTSINGLNALTTISLPTIVNLGVIGVSNNTLLKTFTLGATLKSANQFAITNSVLDVTSVNDILIKLASLDGTNGTTLYSGLIVTITGGASAPTGAGLTAKATLVSRGCTVSTN